MDFIERKFELNLQSFFDIHHIQSSHEAHANPKIENEEIPMNDNFALVDHLLTGHSVI